MKLTSRLETIASLVTKGSKVADIGTDHGYIPVHLLKNNIVPFAILADINKGPLDNGKRFVKWNNLLDKVDFRLGSGIDVLHQGEVDEVIIAGMGGILISDILENKKEVAHRLKKLILQPMQAQNKLRMYLLENGYEIIDEVLVREDFRIYEIIVAEYTGKYSEVENEIYFEVGEKLVQKRDPLLKDFVDKKLKSYKDVLDHLENIDSESIEQKKNETRAKIAKLVEIRKTIEE
ncbi:MAG: SAM-dependent methyltransferase [Clostridioides difficile]|nr:SAM-dependent methyltransferase [Clostridioides difficile]